MTTTARTLAFLVAVIGVATGCHGKRAPGAAATAERRAAEAAHELEHVVVRGAGRVPDELRDAADEVRREREDVAEAAQRERVQYKKTLAKEIASADKRVLELEQELARATGDAKGDKERSVSAARGWRARLKHDLDQLERIGEDEWPEVKDRIDGDLEDERPACIPRSFDSSFTI